MRPIDVAIVSELELLAEGVESLLERDPRVRVVSRLKCPLDAAEEVTIERADVVIATFICATRSCAITQLVRDRIDGPRLIVLADPDDSIDMKQLMRSGVSGVVLTTMPAALLVQSILKVQGGGVFLEKEAVLRHFRHEDSALITSLSERETEVFTMAVAGLRNREIAERLFISAATVKVHLSRIFGKLKVKSRVELCLLAQKRRSVKT